METKEYRLTDICDFQGGTQPPKEEWINEPRDGFVRMLQIRDFTQGKEEHIAYVKDTKKLNKCEEDDILIGRYGASVGKILTGLAGAYNVAIIKTLPNEKLLSKRYLYYVLTATDFQNFILNIGARAAQAGFNKNDLSLFKLHIPTSLEDQERIANVLEKAQGLISKRVKSIDLLDIFLEMKFLEMFGNPIKNDKKWKVTPLEKYGDFKNGLNYNKGDSGITLKCLGVGDFKNLSKIDNVEALDFVSVSQMPSEEYFLKDGDLVFVRSNGNKELVGRSLVVYPGSNVKVTFSGFCIRFRKSSDDINTVYLSHLFRIPLMRKMMLQHGQGANIQNINQKVLGSLLIPVPPIEIQKIFALIVQQVEVLKLQLKENSYTLTDLFGSLTHKALRGNLEVIIRTIPEGNIKVQPKISGEVIAIDKINKELEEFHKSQPNTGAPDEIDNTIRQLEAELKIKGEIPFWDEYVKYRIVKGKFKEPFTFNQLWEEITKFPFETVPEYDEVATLLFKWLSEENAFIRQQFNESTKQIELIVNETAKA